jgi:hypothetical protein
MESRPAAVRDCSPPEPTLVVGVGKRHAGNGARLDRSLGKKETLQRYAYFPSMHRVLQTQSRCHLLAPVTEPSIQEMLETAIGRCMQRRLGGEQALGSDRYLVSNRPNLYSIPKESAGPSRLNEVATLCSPDVSGHPSS